MAPPGADPNDPRERTLVLGASGGDTAHQPPPARHARDLAAEVSPVAQIVIDTSGTLVFANRRARSDVGIGERDLGRRFQDLEISHRPVDLRSRIDQAYSSRAPVHLPAVERALGDGRIQFLDIVITPLADRGETMGASIAFVDVSSAVALQVELRRSKQDLEAAYEALQSANEQLETMNEELQSTNSELQSINTELRQRTDQFDRPG